MRTTLDLDEELLREAGRLSGATTKRALIEEALAEFVRARNADKLRQMIGTYELNLTAQELKRMRRRGTSRRSAVFQANGGTTRRPTCPAST